MGDGTQGADLFPPPAPKSMFSDGLDQHARTVGAWPDGAMVYAAEVVNDGRAIMLTGALPIGVRKDGFARFAKSGPTFQAVTTIEAYRAALAKASGQ